jgi:D-3-phosphoglycerate dehydrogenase
MGKSLAKKLQGFDCNVICYDLKNNVGNQHATQVSLSDLQQQSDVLSLHIPWTPETDKLVNQSFINQFQKPFWLINTARGKNVVTADLVKALKNGKILGAGLDVLEYEKASFEILNPNQQNFDLNYLQQAKNVILTPHIAGWTTESHQKLAQIIVDKIKKTENQ